MELWDVRGLSGMPPGVRSVVGYHLTGAAPGVHLGLPSPTVTLVIDLGAGVELEGPGLPAPTVFRVCLGGLHRTPYRILHDGTQIGVQAEVTPAGLRALFGMPVAEVGSQVIELADVAPALARELGERVFDAPLGERSAVASRILGAAAARALDAPSRLPHPDAAAAWDRIIATDGRVTVAELTERSGWSARYLTARFAAEYGMGPKQAARLVRYDAALADLRAGRGAADVAAARGYADQAHLSREMHAFLGMAPSAFLARLAADFAEPPPPAALSLRESEFTPV